MAGYLNFVLSHRRFLAYGFFLSFASASGQTYVIALFGGEIRAEFGLGHGAFGTIYSLATLASGVLLVGTGRLIDRLDLRLITAISFLGFAAACMGLALAPGVLLLGLAIFGLRFCGQGLISLIATTSMARYFEAGRGKAMTVAALGFQAAQAVYPVGLVALLALLGWRQVWLVMALGLLVLALPAALWLLRGHGLRHRRLLVRSSASDTGSRQWSRREALGDRRFWLLAPAVMAPSYVYTGLFFHQVHLVTVKGWSLAWFASGFLVFSAASVLTALVCGSLIDRFGARRLAAWYMLPMSLSLVLLLAFEHAAVVPFFMITAGITSGAAMTVVGALWAELYGVRNLGAIRSLVWAMMVVASALAPFSMGLLIDAGTGMTAIIAGCLAFTLFGSALMPAALTAPAGAQH
jgi:MFS family permease